uniref:Uncharacterized protein n=1 Tax=Anguilla anguilla TaxID=7936 RepID=A0A0E9SYC1_ANGAN
MSLGHSRPPWRTFSSKPRGRECLKAMDRSGLA